MSTRIYQGFERVLPNVDYLMASSEFPGHWTSERDPFKALEPMQNEYGMHVAGMTLGAHGALARVEGRFVYSPAFVVNCVDTTGAGDVFHGAFCYAVLEGCRSAEALDFSNAMAALNCTALGARGGIRTLDEAPGADEPRRAPRRIRISQRASVAPEPMIPLRDTQPSYFDAVGHDSADRGQRRWCFFSSCRSIRSRATTSSWCTAWCRTACSASTLVTSMFLHGGWMHLIGNMWFLWIFGDNVEDILGHGKYLLFYLLCGVAAALAQFAINPDSRVPTVGASGAIAGVMGAYLVKFPHARISRWIPIFIFITTVELPAVVVLLYWFVMQFFSGVGSVGVLAASAKAAWPGSRTSAASWPAWC